MKGARPYTKDELKAISDFFDSENKPHSIRDKTIFFMCLYTGRRISEILSLQTKDVLYYTSDENKGIKSDIYFRRRNLKGKREGFIALINDSCRAIIQDYIDRYTTFENFKINKNSYFFPNKNNLDLHISRFTAQKMFSRIKANLGLEGSVSTHSCRKTFADLIFRGTGKDLVSLQNALGHKNISSTASYIKSQDKKVLELIRGMNLEEMKDDEVDNFIA
jgi:integrase/recombinase XerD